MKFGDFLHHLRQEQKEKITATAVAKAVGKTPTAILNMEKNKILPSYDVFTKIVLFLDIDFPDIWMLYDKFKEQKIPDKNDVKARIQFSTSFLRDAEKAISESKSRYKAKVQEHLLKQINYDLKDVQFKNKMSELKKWQTLSAKEIKIEKKDLSTALKRISAIITRFSLGTLNPSKTAEQVADFSIRIANPDRINDEKYVSEIVDLLKNSRKIGNTFWKELDPSQERIFKKLKEKK